MSDRERKARSLTKAQIAKELREARSCLRHFYQPFFRDAQIVGPHMIGTDGFYLEWRLRSRPDQPESYENQQTNRGTVVCIGPWNDLPGEER